jgi:uncharacterized caspase-like protein
MHHHAIGRPAGFPGALLRAAFIALVCFLVAAGLSAQDKLAVIVGVNKYDQLTSLRAGVNDAEKIAAYYAGIGFKVWLVDDRQEARMNQPALVNLERVMENVAEVSQGRQVQELVFFFAGHGVQIEGQNWLCFPETQLTSKTGMLNVDTKLVPWLRNLGANLTMVYLDACRNDLGGMRAAGVERGLTVQGLVNEPSAANKPSSGRNLAVFYAAKPGSFSYEKPDGTNGFFTDTLVEALQADSTRNIADLYKYLRTALPERTEKAYGKPQIPNLGGDLDIAASFSKGKVDLSAMDSGGKIYVEASEVGATVTVNGVKRGLSPMLVEGIDPGLVTVEVAKDGKYAASQVAVTLRGYAKINLAMEKLSGDLLVQSVRTKEKDDAPEAKVAAVADFLKGMEVRIDGKAVKTAGGSFIPELEPGSHSVALTGKGWTWEDQISVKPREALRIDPLFVPACSLTVDVPADAVINFVSPIDGTRLEMEGLTDTLKDFPPGIWKVSISGRRYLDATAAIEVAQGGSAELKPKLALKPAFARGVEVKAIQQDIGVKTALLPVQRQSRANSDTVGWIGFGTGLGVLVGGAVVGALSYVTYLDYLAATTPELATQKRADALTLWNVAWPVMAGGGALGFSVSLIGFLGGDQPVGTEATIKNLEAKIKTLEAQGVEY